MEVDDSDVFPFPMGEFSGSSREITEENPGNFVEKKVAVTKIIHEDSIQKSTKTQSEVVLPNQQLVKKTLLHRSCSRFIETYINLDKYPQSHNSPKTNQTLKPKKISFEKRHRFIFHEVGLCRVLFGKGFISSFLKLRFDPFHVL